MVCYNKALPPPRGAARVGDQAQGDGLRLRGEADPEGGGPPELRLGGSVNAWPAFVRHSFARAHMHILIEIALVLVAT